MIEFLILNKVTEKEIFEGIFKENGDPNKSALCFIREIENLEENLNDKSIPRFIDVKYKGDKKFYVDEEAKSLSHDLKNVKIPQVLNTSTNVFYYKVRK